MCDTSALLDLRRTLDKFGDAHLPAAPRPIVCLPELAPSASGKISGRPGFLLGQHVSVEMVTIGRETDGLRFSGVKRGPDGEIWDVWVHLRVAGLDASMRVFLHYANGFDELGGFFRGLAADWRGWPGERTYESVEHELRLTATHNGHVRLAVRLRQSSLPDRYGWSASGEFQVDSGEEMTRAAENLTDLLSPPGSAPEV